MKRSLVLIAFTLLTIVSFGQKSGDYITMKSNGKVYWMRGGESIKMMISVPLKNGETVNNKGAITSPNGKVRQLAPGDKVMMDGTFLKRAQKRL